MIMQFNFICITTGVGIDQVARVYGSTYLKPGSV